MSWKVTRDEELLQDLVGSNKRRGNLGDLGVGVQIIRHSAKL
jgi:hypothetical protein